MDKVTVLGDSQTVARPPKAGAGTPGVHTNTVKHWNKPRLGSGRRFKALKRKLAKKGARNPAALAAWIGRKKYGKKKMAKLSAKGRKH